MDVDTFNSIVRDQLRDNGADPRIATDQTLIRYINLVVPHLANLRPEAALQTKIIQLSPGAYHRVPGVNRVMDVHGFVDTSGRIVRRLTRQPMAKRDEKDPDRVACNEKKPRYFDLDKNDPSAIWIDPPAKGGERVQVLASGGASVTSTSSEIPVQDYFLMALKDLVMAECYQALDGGMTQNVVAYREAATNVASQDAAIDEALDNEAG